MPTFRSLFSWANVGRKSLILNRTPAIRSISHLRRIMTVSRTSERFRVRQQPGKGKADALNFGLSQAHGEYVFFIDADVVLRGDEIWRTCQVLEDGADFASCGYGSRPPMFPIISNFGGWFSACRANAL